MSGGYSLNMDADLLIKEVYLRRPLWDRTNKQHGNRVLVNRLWEEVAQVVGAPKDAVKNKWKGLRDTFRAELAKTPDGREGDTSLHPDDYLTSWCYFKALFFLRGHVGCRQRTSGISEVLEDVTEDSGEQQQYEEESEDIKPIISGVGSVLVDMDFQGTQSNTNSDQPWNVSSSHNDSVDNNSFTTVTIKKECNGEVDCSFKKPPAIVEYGRLESADDDYFFKSLLPYIKSVPPQRKMLLRMKIQELVWKEITTGEL